MGVLDKIKNALFEVEYVEVDEPPKKEKKSRFKEKEKREDKPIAKKIVLPGKREEKVEELQEEELRDEDFEIRPKDELVKEKPREEFKFMDDNDFKVDDEILPEEPEILHVIDNETEKDSKVEPKLDENHSASVSSQDTYEKEEQYDDYYSKPTYSYSRESKPYGLDSSYTVPIHEYGTYEKKEEKTYFKPSPIISPIYGILDKNYRKEDVREKKDVRITSNYTRTNVSVDDIRNKAYGEQKREEVVEEDTKFEVDEEDDENLLVDLSDRSKPEVKELTMGDALEYFQDLGLEYNVDYVDVSKEKTNKRVREPNSESISGNQSSTEVSPIDQPQEAKVEKVTEVEHDTPIVEVKDESKKQSSDIIDEEDDNLFDLIDSMYQEKD